MPLQLDAVTQNISTPSGDTGTYTWADVVALNSTLMTSHTQAGGRTLYRWRGILIIRGTAVLNVLDEFIELLGNDTTNPGRIAADENAKINFGEETTVNGKIVHRKGCQILVTRAFKSSVNNSHPRFVLSFFEGSSAIWFNEGAGSVQTAEVNLYGSCIRFSPLNSTVNRVDIAITRAKSCLFQSTVSTPSWEGVVCYIRRGGAVDLVTLVQTDIEFYGINITFNAINTIEPISGILNWTNNRLPVRGFSAINPVRSWRTNHKSAIDFIDSPNVTLSGGRVDREGSFVTPLESRKIVSQNYKLVDAGGAVSGALISFAGRSNVSSTSNALGEVSELLLIIEETNVGSLAFPGSNYQPFGGSAPLPVIDYSAYVLEIKSYLHEPVRDTNAITSQVGSSTLPFTRQLVVDTGVTQANTTTVAAYTGITHTATTITVTQPRSLNEIYDSRKLYWRNTAGVSPPYKESDVFNLGGANLVIDGVTLVPATKFGYLETTGTISFINGGNATVPIEDSNGIRTSISITGLIVGSEVRLYDEATGNEFAGVESCSNSVQSFYYFYSAGVTLTLVVFKADCIPVRLTGIALTSTAQFVQVQQRFDRIYANS